MYLGKRYNTMSGEINELELLKNHMQILLERSDFDSSLNHCIENAFHLCEQVDKKEIEGTNTVTHCYFLLPNSQKSDCDYESLAEKMFDALVDYVIPRSKIQEADGLAVNFSKLQRIARKKFIDFWVYKKKLLDEKKISPTDFRRSGEGGEVLLFLLSEQILKLPQAICKMSFKTSGDMPIHGSDGIHIGLTEDGTKLALYYGEAKVHADLNEAIRDCVTSITPFLLKESDENDLFLLNTYCDFGNSDIEKSLKEKLKIYFDKEHRKYKLCTDIRGICLVAFNDKDSYSFNDIQDTSRKVTEASEKWINKFIVKVKENKLEQIVINVFFIPMSSVDAFRSSFARIVGGQL